MLKLKKTFTLIEVTVSMAVFAIILAVAGTTFYLIFDGWRRQRNVIDMVQNARWAMELAVSEIRLADVVGVNNGLGVKWKLYLERDEDDDTFTERVWYWEGETHGVNTYGDEDILYRGVDDDAMEVALPQSFNEALGNAVPVAKFIANEGSPPERLFQESSGEVTIELRLHPELSETDGTDDNRSYLMRTKVRKRN